MALTTPCPSTQHPNALWTPPGSVTPPPLWAAHSSAWPPFQRSSIDFLLSCTYAWTRGDRQKSGKVNIITWTISNLFISKSPKPSIHCYGGWKGKVWSKHRPTKATWIKACSSFVGWNTLSTYCIFLWKCTHSSWNINGLNITVLADYYEWRRWKDSSITTVGIRACNHR